MAHAPDLTVLIPVYNEESLIIPNTGRLMRFIEECGLCGEILLGSNGSTDATPLLGELLEEAFPGAVRFFHIEQRGAVGTVFKEAARLASSPILISMDMDLSVDLHFIPRALWLLRSNAVVIGSKKSGSQSRSLVRRLGSGAFILCARTLLQLPFDDYSLGAKAYRLESIRPWIHELSEDTNYVFDLVYHAYHAKQKIAVLPVVCEDWRRSRFHLPREALTRFSHLFCFWARSRLILPRSRRS